MMGWIACAVVYGLGCAEVWMVRRNLDHEASRVAMIIGVLMWPLFVPIALVARD